jgi:hypothetical protein
MVYILLIVGFNLSPVYVLATNRCHCGAPVTGSSIDWGLFFASFTHKPYIMIALEKLAALKSYEASPVFECTEELGTLSLNESGVSLVESKNGKSIRFHHNGKTYYFPVKDRANSTTFAIRQMTATRDWEERNISAGDTYVWAYGVDTQEVATDGMPF